jgi:hypothetical protein
MFGVASSLRQAKIKRHRFNYKKSLETFPACGRQVLTRRIPIHREETTPNEGKQKLMKNRLSLIINIIYFLIFAFFGRCRTPSGYKKTLTD